MSEPTVGGVGVATPGHARFDVVIDTLHGVPVPDPLRWLEDTASAETRAWVRVQNAYTDSVLARLVHVDSIRTGLEQYYAAAPTLGDVVPTPRRIFLTRYLGPSPSLFSLDSAGAQEREILPIKSLSKAGSEVSLRTFVPSWDGRYVALGVTERGDANAAIVVVDAETGRVLPDGVRDLLTTTSGTRYQVSWLPDGSGFFYPKLWPASATSTSEQLARGRQYLHRLGTPASADVPVFGFELSAAVLMDKDDLPTRVGTAPESGWMTASMFRSRLNGTDHYAAPLVLGREQAAKWMQIAQVTDRMSNLRLRGDTVYALSRQNADRGKIVKLVLRAGVLPEWQTVIAERPGVLTEFVVQDDAIYATERSGGDVRVLRLPHGATVATEISLPFTGGVQLARSQTGVGATFVTASWATPPHWLRTVGDSAQALGIEDGFQPSAASTIIAERLQAPSKDGTKVPISIVYGKAALRNGKLDGSAPLLIDAYGAFGVSSDPTFEPLIQYWVSIGGVYAYAHVRGGGELGDAWHAAALRERKQNSIDDMIGAIEHLIARKYTSAKRVSMIGTSFGANIPGLTMVQRPDLIGAVLYEVGQPDEIRGSKTDPTAARNIAEVGDLDTPAGIRSLMKASPYHQVPASVNLPAVIVHSATADYNFGNQMLSGKYVARLQKANTGTRPTLWVQTDGGHSALFGVSPAWAAKALSFILWQTGDTRYQPEPRDKP